MREQRAVDGRTNGLMTSHPKTRRSPSLAPPVQDRRLPCRRSSRSPPISRCSICRRSRAHRGGSSLAGYQQIGIRLLPASPGGASYPLMHDAGALADTLAPHARDTGVGVFDLEIVRLGSRLPDARTALSPHRHRRGASQRRRARGRAALRPLASHEPRRRRRHPASPDALHPDGDAPAEVPVTTEGLIHTARCERLLPGEGGIDLARDCSSTLPKDLPISVEIPNDKRARPNSAPRNGPPRQALVASRTMLERLGT